MDAVTMAGIGASEFVAHPALLVAVTDHFESCLAHGNAILTDAVSVFVFEVYATPFVQIDDSGNGVLLAELVYRHYIMG